MESPIWTIPHASPSRITLTPHPHASPSRITQASNVEASFLQILSEIYRKKSNKEQAAAAGDAGTIKVKVEKEAKKSCC